MIWKPRIGEPVEIRYRKGVRNAMPLQGRSGMVVVTPQGRGPRNVGVRIGDSVHVVPRGNLFRRSIK